jgi:hypothetical protein
MLVVDVSCNASDVAHSVAMTTAIDALDGFTVRKVSDRMFLMHLGGKIDWLVANTNIDKRTGALRDVLSGPRYLSASPPPIS